ncbi:MAG: hypothetical protein ACO3JL_09940 [Myxococcota bacterium]
MIDYIVVCALAVNSALLGVLWHEHLWLRRQSLKTIVEKRREFLEHREKMRGETLEICDNMWSHPSEWCLTFDGARHRSGVAVMMASNRSISICAPQPLPSLSGEEEKELREALRYIQSTQMRGILAGEGFELSLRRGALAERSISPSEVGVRRIAPAEEEPVSACRVDGTSRD